MSTTPRHGTVAFYFDIQCPFAYLASERISDLARFQGADIVWTPVLLGGLYDLTAAEQGKGGSASDVMPPAKKAMVSSDFAREISRYKVPLKFHPNHPLRTVDAGRLLCAFPPQYRTQLAQALFRAYWIENDNVSSRATLLRIARSLKLTSVASPSHTGPFSLTPSLPFVLDESVFTDPQWASQLRTNTDVAFGRGVFGVPAFYLEDRAKLFWGQDRLPLLEAELISIKLNKPVAQVRQLERLMPRCLRTPPEDRVRVLHFWFDFSSPWSYLGWSQLERLQRDAGPGLKIVYKPFLLGALFREIGTPMLPGASQNPTKQAYGALDLAHWTQYWSAVNSQEYPPIPALCTTWPDVFPIRSVTALRVAILEPKTIPVIYRAAWKFNKNISEPAVLAEVLNENGFAGEKLIASCTGEAKATLTRNTQDAIARGICGAPTFEIAGHLVWGQDRINVVEDLILGWKPETSKLKATVSAFPHYDYRL